MAKFAERVPFGGACGKGVHAVNRWMTLDRLCLVFGSRACLVFQRQLITDTWGQLRLWKAPSGAKQRRSGPRCEWLRDTSANASFAGQRPKLHSHCSSTLGASMSILQLLDPSSLRGHLTLADGGVCDPLCDRVNISPPIG